MTQHTAGPWEVKRDELEYSLEGMYLKGLVIATEDAAIAHLIEWQPPLEAEANARLIAAAPDLLAALQWIADHGDTGAGGRPAFHDMRDHARKAIAQAERRP